MEELNQEIVENLKRSRNLLGELEPVLIDQNGNVIDGRHRLKAYPGWAAKTIQISDRKSAIIYRLHKNFRRDVSKDELRKLLDELALILKQEGIPQERIAREIVHLSPYSESYTLSLLSKKYKEPKSVKAAKATYRVLYQEKNQQPPKKREDEKVYTCPICGTALKLVDNLLIVSK